LSQRAGALVIARSQAYIGGGSVSATGAAAKRISVMLDTVYNKKILELAADIPRLGRLKSPHATAKAHSKLCGSTVVVDLSIEDGRVSDFAHDVKACALGQASSSLMARHVIGATPDELVGLRDAMRRMLRENGPPPDGKWAAFAALEPVRDYKARHASTLLTFEAVADALAQIEARAAVAVK
jgi:NifU-like protein involved in Fe-S cluster formation